MIKICSKCEEEKELDCFGPKANQCKSCISKKDRERYLKNKDKILERAKQYRRDNKEKIREGKKTYKEKHSDRIAVSNGKYYKENKEQISKRKKEYDKLNLHLGRARNKTYREKNKERLKINNEEYRKNNKDKIKATSKKYRQNNKGKVNARVVKRQLAKLQRIPAWADNWKIQQFYIMAQKLTKLYGVEFHVDHKIPLQGKLVSGLHIETNLQIITESENCKKGNKFIPGYYL